MLCSPQTGVRESISSSSLGSSQHDLVVYNTGELTADETIALQIIARLSFAEKHPKIDITFEERKQLHNK